MQKQSDNAVIDRTIMALLATLESGKSLDPTLVARQIAGPDEQKWRLVMKPIRARAIALAHDESLVILRKGKPADPDNFKGLYRLGPVE
ncbi:MAG: hypothetical protein COA52_06120 [Hyphomicrobiales bacterium]|nr:DUF3253 domain-containing protein [Hyphomicrobiales bacterium]PCJ93992.1 MAG: hypothetical protein COA52_06120 [Hyphomicrobiales bacterium]